MSNRRRFFAQMFGVAVAAPAIVESVTKPIPEPEVVRYEPPVRGNASEFGTATWASVADLAYVSAVDVTDVTMAYSRVGNEWILAQPVPWQKRK
jgi:hypothetical protein